MAVVLSSYAKTLYWIARSSLPKKLPKAERLKQSVTIAVAMGNKAILECQARRKLAEERLRTEKNATTQRLDLSRITTTTTAGEMEEAPRA